MEPASTEIQSNTVSENDIRVAVIGNVDSGKSTLVGVLSKCVIDDGRGYARGLVFNYSHEHANGRTSSVTQEIMGFRGDRSQVQPERVNESRNKLWAHIADQSSTMITFLDLCGHERYLKTTIFGLVGCMPDYAMIIVGANMGITRMSKEHIGLALALKVPLFFVVTKIDIAPANIYQETVETIKKIMKSRVAGNKIPLVVRDDIETAELSHAIEDNICPIFCVSNVTGEGVDRLRDFLSKLPPRHGTSGMFGSATDPVECMIDGVYMVTGVGLVVAGTLTSGTVNVNQQLLLGPDRSGQFRPIVIRSIHVKRTLVPQAIAGQSVCFNIRGVGKKENQLRKNNFRKGMVIVDQALHPVPIWEFEAEVVILQHATTIKPNYQAVIHCGVVRQAAKVVNISKELLRAGDKGLVRFRFMYHPEMVKPEMTILFREGRTKGLGKIVTLYP